MQLRNQFNQDKCLMPKQKRPKWTSFLFAAVVTVASQHSYGASPEDQLNGYPVRVSTIKPAINSNASEWNPIRSWRTIYSVFTNWNASVTQLDVPGPGKGLISVCGDSRFVAFLIDAEKDFDGTLRFSLGLIDLQSGNGTRIDSMLPLHEIQRSFGENFDETSYRALEIACSPDRKNLSLDLFSLGAKTNSRLIFNIDLAENKIKKTGEIIESKQNEVDTSFLNYDARALFHSAVYDREPVILKRIATPMANSTFETQVRVVQSSVGLFAYPVESVFYERNLPKTARMFSLAFANAEGRFYTSCEIKLKKNEQIQMIGKSIVRISHKNDRTSAQVFKKVKYSKKNSRSACIFERYASMPVVNSLPGTAASISQYANGGDDGLIELTYPTPESVSEEIPINMTFHSFYGIAEVYSVSIPFNGVNPEDAYNPMIWAIPGHGKINSTFVYGPHGRGTTLIHLWAK